jgi:exodeoxyribonuclease V
MFRATYSGTCAFCGAEINSGDSMGVRSGVVSDAPACMECIDLGDQGDYVVPRTQWTTTSLGEQQDEVELTAEQQDAVDKISRRFGSGAREVTLGGLAGTGKTTLAARFADRGVVFAAPTGKAVDNLRRRIPELDPPPSTLHSLLYVPSVVTIDGERHLSWASKDRTALDNASLVVIDEASMIAEREYNELMGHGVRVVFIGDHGQLPPVNGDFNLMEEPDIRLETVHRQKADSSILQLAYDVRQGAALEFMETSEVTVAPWKGAVDFDPATTQAICHTNLARVMMNMKARHLLDLPPDSPVPGDRVICLRTQRGRAFNGQTGVIRSCRRRDGESYSVEIELDFTDEVYRGPISAEQFHATSLPEAPSRDLGLWDYSYATTVHKAQGSEYDDVLLLAESTVRGDRARWLYTGITRASNTLRVLVPPPGWSLSSKHLRAAREKYA